MLPTRGLFLLSHKPDSSKLDKPIAKANSLPTRYSGGITIQQIIAVGVCDFKCGLAISLETNENCFQYVSSNGDSNHNIGNLCNSLGIRPKCRLQIFGSQVGNVFCFYRYFVNPALKASLTDSVRFLSSSSAILRSALSMSRSR